MCGARPTSPPPCAALEFRYRLHALPPACVAGETHKVNKRRTLIATLGGLLAFPDTVPSQQAGRTYRLGFLSSVSPRTEAYNIAFVQRLRDLGFVEGRNLIIEFRNAEGRLERLRALAIELVKQKCDLLVAPGTELNLIEITQASRDTPIVMVANDYDPVSARHIASLARPGGRITGISMLQEELPAKRLELLKELVPKARRFAVFADISTAGQLKVVQAGAKKLDVGLQVIELKAWPYDYDGAFAEAVRGKADVLLVLTSGLFVSARRLIPELALKHRLPSMCGNYLWPDAGALASYGPNFSDSYRRAAEMVAMILNGRKPADIPVEQPTKFELVINMKTARALGIAIPHTIQIRAERMIE